MESLHRGPPTKQPGTPKPAPEGGSVYGPGPFSSYSPELVLKSAPASKRCTKGSQEVLAQPVTLFEVAFSTGRAGLRWLALDANSICNYESSQL